MLTFGRLLLYFALPPPLSCLGPLERQQRRLRGRGPPPPLLKLRLLKLALLLLALLPV